LTKRLIGVLRGGDHGPQQLGWVWMVIIEARLSSVVIQGCGGSGQQKICLTRKRLVYSHPSFSHESGLGQKIMGLSVGSRGSRGNCLNNGS